MLTRSIGILIWGLMVGSYAEAATVILNGKEISVRWSDGDTFSWTEEGKKQSARLNGYNSLESFGPVHRWGTWTGSELYALAKGAGERAKIETWRCEQLPGGGGYGRVLVDCPELRRVLISEGLAHLYQIDGEGDPQELALQQSAMDRRLGIWAKGVPERILTSVHSTAEGHTSTYDRACSVTTAECTKIEHQEAYATCQDVCHYGSCMLYVPFAERYGYQAPKAKCLYL